MNGVKQQLEWALSAHKCGMVVCDDECTDGGGGG
jgi:hypothetical protein